MVDGAGLPPGLVYIEHGAGPGACGTPLSSNQFKFECGRPVFQPASSRPSALASEYVNWSACIPGRPAAELHPMRGLGSPRHNPHKRAYADSTSQSGTARHLPANTKALFHRLIILSLSGTTPQPCLLQIQCCNSPERRMQSIKKFFGFIGDWCDFMAECRLNLPITQLKFQQTLLHVVITDFLELSHFQAHGKQFLFSKTQTCWNITKIPAPLIFSLSLCQYV